MKRVNQILYRPSVDDNEEINSMSPTKIKTMIVGYEQEIERLKADLALAVEALTAIGNMTTEPVTRQFADDRLAKIKGGE